jgi:formylglycine-generating enzyme required for sulfatase activity
MTLKNMVLFVLLSLFILFHLNCGAPSVGSEILEGDIEPNPRTEQEELDFIRGKALKMAQNSRGYWEAEFIHGIVMIYIPAGTFIMGNDKLSKGISGNPAAPQHKVTLFGYWIGKTPITKGQFRAFVEEAGYVTSVEKPGHEGPWIYAFEEKGFITIPGFNWDNAFSQVTARFPHVQIDDDHPVSCVSWYDAVDFCQWLASKTGVNFKLPTEAEWEYAARGDDQRSYPWGNEDPDGTRANYADEDFNAVFPDTGQSIVHFGVRDGYAATSPVGSYPAGASPFGALDMAGNLTEWVHDWIGEYEKKHYTNPIGPKEGKDRVMKAGFWAGSAGRFDQTPDELIHGHNIRSDARQYDDPDSADDHLGFRIAIDYIIR